jgi:hypothetical protein
VIEPGFVGLGPSRGLWESGTATMLRGAAWCAMGDVEGMK